MEVDSLRQLSILLQAVGLGWGLGLLYDLLRAARLRCRRAAIAAALDALYGLALFTLVFLFALRVGGGELRLFLLIGLGLGLLAFFLLCSAALRPLWALWVDAALRLWQLVTLPVHWLWRQMKIFLWRVKKLFHFLRKCYIISYRKQYSRLARRRRRSHGRS